MRATGAYGTVMVILLVQRKAGTPAGDPASSPNETPAAGRSPGIESRPAAPNHWAQVGAVVCCSLCAVHWSSLARAPLIAGSIARACSGIFAVSSIT